MKYDPLNIPIRDHKKGQYLYCGKSGKNLSRNENGVFLCCQTGKALRSCKFPEHNRFESKVYSKEKKRMVRLKIWDKETRSYQDFDDKHSAATKKGKVVSIKGKKPTILRGCIRYYNDWVNNIDPETKKELPAHQRNKYTDKWRKQILDYLIHFRDALTDSGIDVNYLSIYDINGEHVGIFHEWLTEIQPNGKPRYANKTYNHHIAQCWKFFDTLKKKFRYNIELNPFDEDEIKRLPTKERTEVMQYDEFNRLIAITKPENGFFYQKVKIRGQVRDKKRTVYKPWVTLYWRLSLFSGLRPEDVVMIEVEKCHKDYVMAYEKKQGRWRFVPMVEELSEVISELKQLHTGEDKYLIGEGLKRSYVQDIASEAFSHYVKQLNLGRRLILYDLRNTYATQGEIRFGKDFNKVFDMHVRSSTTDKHYKNWQEVQKSQNYKVSMFA